MEYRAADSHSSKGIEMSKLFISAVFFALLTCVSPASFAANTQPVDATKTVAVSSSAIDLNAADAETLTRELAGIGASKAQAIVEYRETHGAFSSVDDLLEVNGIGAATLEKNRSKLTVH